MLVVDLANRRGLRLGGSRAHPGPRRPSCHSPECRSASSSASSDSSQATKDGDKITLIECDIRSRRRGLPGHEEAPREERRCSIGSIRSIAYAPGPRPPGQLHQDHRQQLCHRQRHQLVRPDHSGARSTPPHDPGRLDHRHDLHRLPSHDPRRQCQETGRGIAREPTYATSRPEPRSRPPVRVDSVSSSPIPRHGHGAQRPRVSPTCWTFRSTHAAPSRRDPRPKRLQTRASFLLSEL